MPITFGGSNSPVSPEKLNVFCVEAMLKYGMRATDAQTTAKVLVTADMWGIFTHDTRHQGQSE